MAYIGKLPTVGNFQVCDAIAVVDAQAAYTMQVGSVNVVPESANNMIVSLNGVIQAPISSYTVSGSTITFASNLVTGDSIDFIQILGDVLSIGTPSDGTVSLAKLSATGTKDSTTFLRGDNTFAAAGLDGWSSSSGNLLPADAAKGIYLGVATATAANLLDDYEEGTWTPGVNQGTINNISSSYIKVGNKVTIFSNIDTFSNRTSTESVRISGLPFAISGDTQGKAVGSIMIRYSDKLVSAAYSRSGSAIGFYASIASGYVPLKFNDLNNSSANMTFIATYTV